MGGQEGFGGGEAEYSSEMTLARVECRLACTSPEVHMGPGHTILRHFVLSRENTTAEKQGESDSPSQADHSKLISWRLLRGIGRYAEVTASWWYYQIPLRPGYRPTVFNGVDPPFIYTSAGKR